MKWFLALVAAALVAAFVYWQANTTKTAYINGLAPYDQWPGREYIFERDCYIFQFKRHVSVWPLVGANVPGAQMSVPALPAEVSPKFIGAKLPDVYILGIARVGDRFRIASVRRDQNRRGTRITFEILFTNESEHRYSRLDAFWIMDHRPEAHGAAPTILSDYAVERVMR